MKSWRNRPAARLGAMCAAALAVSAPRLSARGETVTFDAALTNSTGWAYAAGVKYSTGEKAYYISAGSGRISSPTCGMAITSVVATARRTSDSATARRLFVRPTVSYADPDSLAADITPPGTERAVVSCAWRVEDSVRALEFLPVGGTSGNIYLYSAEILGVPLVGPPTCVMAGDVGATRFTLTWTNSPGAAYTTVEMSKVVRHGGAGEVVANLDFAAFSNVGGTAERTQAVVAAYPELAGSSLLYFPTNSEGQIQLSNGSRKGVLVHEGFDDYAGLSLKLVLKRYNHKDEADAMSVSYIDGDKTNDIASVALGYAFSTETVALDGVPAGRRLALNAAGKATNHRVIIDDMSFVRGEQSAWAETNAAGTVTVAGDVSRLRLRNLEPLSSYIVRLRAGDGEAESEPAEPVEVQTGKNDPMTLFTVR